MSETASVTVRRQDLGRAARFALSSAHGSREGLDAVLDDVLAAALTDRAAVTGLILAQGRLLGEYVAALDAHTGGEASKGLRALIAAAALENLQGMGGQGK